MKKVVFTLDFGEDCAVETFVFENKATDEEINESFKEWASEFGYWNFCDE